MAERHRRAEDTEQLRDVGGCGMLELHLDGADHVVPPSGEFVPSATAMLYSSCCRRLSTGTSVSRWRRYAHLSPRTKRHSAPLLCNPQVAGGAFESDPLVGEFTTM